MASDANEDDFMTDMKETGVRMVFCWVRRTQVWTTRRSKLQASELRPGYGQAQQESEFEMSEEW